MTDIQLLRLLLAHEQLDNDLHDKFKDMLDQLLNPHKRSISNIALSARQRAMADAVAMKLGIEYAENLVSEGKVPDPNAVFAPLDKMPKPLKPPGRR